MVVGDEKLSYIEHKVANQVQSVIIAKIYVERSLSQTKSQTNTRIRSTAVSKKKLSCMKISLAYEEKKATSHYLIVDIADVLAVKLHSKKKTHIRLHEREICE